MAQTKITLPRYTRAVRMRTGAIRYYWELPHWARSPAERGGHTCPVGSETLGETLDAAIAKAGYLNDALDAWRSGIERGPAKGSVAWLFQWYKKQDRFTSKSAKTRHDYAQIMRRLSDEQMRIGVYGQRAASAINATAADEMYRRWRKRHGDRQAGYAMQVSRLVWNWAVRHHEVTGVSSNPFKGMGISTRVQKGNRPTKRDEYDLYRETAREMGFQSMATAAALAFELCQRVYDVFGFEDPDGRKARGFLWSEYHPAVQISYVQSKTGKKMSVPMTEILDGDEIKLFPELEAELARTPQRGTNIVVDDKSHELLTYDQMAKRHRRICERAGLPKDMTFTGFRHGGITELGDAGIDDTRAISGHAQLQTTAIYNRASQAKAKAAQLARNRYLETEMADK